MAVQSFKLQKKVFSNERARTLTKTDFSSLAKSEEYMDESKIKNLYDSSFYNIPKTGRDSHENIVEQTYAHVRGSAIDHIDSNITKLHEDIKSKEN